MSLSQFPLSASELTCIILTYNEQENIEATLRSIDWIPEVVIVDSGSKDRTIEIAKQARPDVKVFCNPFENFGQQRNWAIDHCNVTSEWILFLDADEHSTDDFAQGIRDAIRDPKDCVGFFLTYRNMFLGKWLKRSTFYPSWQLRLLKRGEVRFRAEGHGQREVTDGRLGRIHQPYDHFPFQNGLESWLAKHNRYSTTECELVLRLRSEPVQLSDLFHSDPVKRRRCLKRLASRVGFRPFLRFFYTYILRGGFLDGIPGYIYCRLMAQYEFQLWAKLKELNQKIAQTSSK